MDTQAVVHEILDHLAEVQRLREARRGDLTLDRAVMAVKTFQQARFERTYGDLLASPRHAAATRFFLSDLYGPADHSLRDAQFAKVVPAMARLFPIRVVTTIRQLGELHQLSEEMDHVMGLELLAIEPLTAEAYRRAWQAVGRPDARQRQLALALAIGTELDELTRSFVLRKGLHLMRPAAQAAGLGALQRFLETGFDAFAAMGGAGDFLKTVARREEQLFEALFGNQLDLPAWFDNIPSPKT